MYRSIEAFLRYFEGLHRRTIRDIGALPEDADGWRPATGEGEKAWSINKLVGHIAGSRLYFASAYLGRGWISPEPPEVGRRERWIPALEESFERFGELVGGTPDAWLERKIPMIDSSGSLSGWRILAMMTEHEVHHRSQIDAYAGLNGWDVPQIYNRAAEEIGALQAAEGARHGLTAEGHAL